MIKRAGFTLIELILAVVVIAILVTISAVGYIAVQQQGRDTKRAANATAIAEALEKYYDRNGEYPGCADLTLSPATIRTNTLVGIDESVFITPSAAAGVTNALKCSDLLPTSNGDYFGYVGDTTSQCQTGNSCTKWTLKYREEETNSIAKIDSRRSSPTVIVSEPSTLTVRASIVGSTARGTAGGGTCGTGATIERQVRYRSTNTSATGTWSAWTSTAQLDTPADQGYQYSFEQQGRCVSGASSSSWVSSTIDSAVRAITTTPPAITVTISAGDPVLVFSRTNTTCPAGTTARYQYKYVADWDYDSGWNGPTTSASFNWTAAGEGYEYEMQIQAHCYTVYSTGPWSGTGSASYIRPVSPPDGIASNFSHTVSGDRTSRVFSWTGPTCNTGARPEYRWNSYIGSSAMYWVATGQPGWLYGDGGWSERGYFSSTTTSPMQTGTVPYGVPVLNRVQYMCVNSVTGRTSTWGPATNSPMFNT